MIKKSDFKNIPPNKGSREPQTHPFPRAYIENSSSSSSSSSSSMNKKSGQKLIFAGKYAVTTVEI